MNQPRARHPQQEANGLLSPQFWGLVLEPSPPAVLEDPWWSDDPTDPAAAPPDLITVGATSDAGQSWDQQVGEHPELKEYVQQHWLSPTLLQLSPPPANLEVTRTSLHQLAFFALAPARHQINRKIALRYTGGGFGTPFFAPENQVRVEGTHIVKQSVDQLEHQPITTIKDVCSFLGVEYREVWFEDFHDPPPASNPDRPLTVEEPAARFLADWFGFSTLVLEEARRTQEAEQVSRVQLWPEHFDPAFEMGANQTRASYGASPGDSNHPEPYFYIAPWSEVDQTEEFWNDPYFNGASLPYQDLLDSESPFSRALGFLRAGYAKLPITKGKLPWNC